MNRHYQNPPVLEALCQFKFEPIETWDGTIAERFYERVRPRFPQRRCDELSGRHWQFRRSEGSALLQVAPHRLIVNQLAPYPSWPKLEQMILSAYQDFLEVAPSQKLASVGLRYINQIDIPGKSIDVARYFRNCPASQSKLFVSAEFPFAEAGEQLFFLLAEHPRAAENSSRFILDLDYRLPVAAPLAADEVETALQRAHGRIAELFESSITDEARRLFGEMPGVFYEEPQPSMTFVRDIRASYGAPKTAARASFDALPENGGIGGYPTAVVQEEAIAEIYRERGEELRARAQEWQTAEEREAERWERMEMEMGAEKDVVFKAPNIPKRRITAALRYRGRLKPKFYHDPVEEE
jgi:uncharacterized protein (TIGR04255 family)